ncbi:chemotaxis protein CheX [Pseudobacteroides cellulosolvens]|uniref:Putative chemotaxis phosphatase, CheX n=1 Tax=Pseudobacteroides cellulosolvens ATCC 35603 = DSM 2933 TaxID=398512 RepID=A0A0L6JUQ0_9FIRM|nr:chemotaxis protein CheX [Pseudobacteroides cellulosolvens]KNY29553.1 putative chemotaxis phosphatase, CheX [Pseudobacteroides cellulosolvens ATCC 35603 = DSM 2933]
MRAEAKTSMTVLHHCFVEALCEAVEKMTGFCVCETSKDCEIKSTDISGAMILSGERNALFVVSVSRKTALNLISFMVGEDADHLSEEELSDGISELVNMAAGIAKIKLLDSDKKFNLSSPFAVTGDNIRITVKKHIERYEYTIGCEDVVLGIGIFYF